MRHCVIASNHGDGLKCEGGGGAYGNVPQIDDSNACGNAKFDLCCDQRESQTFSNVYVGKQAAAALEKDKDAVLPNVIDFRATHRKETGAVILKGSPKEPVASAGVAQRVLELARSYTKWTLDPSLAAKEQSPRGE